MTSRTTDSLYKLEKLLFPKKNLFFSRNFVNEKNKFFFGNNNFSVEGERVKLI